MIENFQEIRCPQGLFRQPSKHNENLNDCLLLITIKKQYEIKFLKHKLNAISVECGLELSAADGQSTYEKMKLLYHGKLRQRNNYLSNKKLLVENIFLSPDELIEASSLTKTNHGV